MYEPVTAPSQGSRALQIGQESGQGGHIPALDGLRGLAVLLVLMYDCLKLESGGLVHLLIRKVAASGWIGVDLFFVLSGFLITGILLETVGRPGYWKSFILRRSLRIFPLYYGSLILVFAILPYLAHLFAVGELTQTLQAVREQQVWYWFYGQNWLYAWQGAWPDDRVLNHFWSLAVEEQFYLIWPLVICLIRGKRLVMLCLGLCLLALGLRFYLLLSGVPPVTTYVMTITRMDSLCAGALLAICVNSTLWQASWKRWLPLTCGCWLGLMLGVDAVYPLLKSESFGAYTIGHCGIAILFTLLIGSLLVLPDRHPLARGFCWAGLISLGKYSYAIYVFHRAVYYSLLRLDWSFLPPAGKGWGIFAATLAGSWLVARLSWWLWESRFLALKKYVPRPGVSRNGNSVSSPQREPADQPQLSAT